MTRANNISSKAQAVPSDEDTGTHKRRKVLNWLGGQGTGIRVETENGSGSGKKMKEKEKKLKLTKNGAGLKPKSAVERPPPPSPTPLDFPKWVPSGSTKPFTPESADEVYAKFVAIKGLASVKREHVEALNLVCETDVVGRDLVPEGVWPEDSDEREEEESNKDVEPELETQSEAETETPSEAVTASTSTDATATPVTLDSPTKESFDKIKREVLLDNDFAFSAIHRTGPKLPKEAVRPRVCYRFWSGIDLISQYWDSSRDHYYEVEEDVLPEEEESKPVGPGEGPRDSDSSKKRKRSKYEGRRMETGRNMPDFYRENCLHGLLEPIAWAFGCSVSRPRMQPRVALQKALFPVRLTRSMGRNPRSRKQVQREMTEGPVLGLQCRPEIQFRPRKDLDSADALNCGDGYCAERLSLLREVGAGLLLAQERAREGQIHRKPGEGEWYTTVPRWGGKPGGDVGDTTGNTDDVEPLCGNGKEEPRKRPASVLRSRRETNAEMYSKVAPGSGTWDPNTIYMRIGTPAESEIDHVYLVSAINHHISILELRVHSAYLAFLEHGTLPDEDFPALAEDGKPWYELRLRRTKWYDLFQPQDRLESVKVLWAIMAHLLKDTGSENPASESDLGCYGTWTETE